MSDFIYIYFLAQCTGKMADKALISQFILHIFFDHFQAMVHLTQKELLDWDRYFDLLITILQIQSLLCTHLITAV